MKVSKYWIAVFLLLGTACTGAYKGQKFEPGCEQVVLDVELGTVNGLTPKATQKIIEKQFPCKQSLEESKACGPSVVLSDLSLQFFPEKKAFHAFYPFSGRQVQRILLESEAHVKELFGEPVKSELQGAIKLNYYSMPYGTLVVGFDHGKARELWVYYATPDRVEICR